MLDPAKDGELRVHAAERVVGSFERSVRLPEFVDAETIQAEFTNGLLTVTVPVEPQGCPGGFSDRRAAQRVSSPAS